MTQQEQTEQYLAQRLSRFIHPRENVLLCFTHQEQGSLCALFARVLRLIGAVPVLWGEDLRWKVLLRRAFTNRVTAVIGGCMTLAALAKMAAATGTPLRVRNALICGDTSDARLRAAVERWLDCRVWGCCNVGDLPQVMAFTCEARLGFHLWEDRYRVRILGKSGREMPIGGSGELELTDLDDGAIYLTGDLMRTLPGTCSCGDPSLRLSRIHGVASLEDTLELHGSVLDYQVRQSEYGMELELVAFAGKPLPKLPTCARRTVRLWNPDEDCPLRPE